jgi:hypothetical protein
MDQFETNASTEGPKPIYLKPLTPCSEQVRMKLGRILSEVRNASGGVFRCRTTRVWPAVRGPLDHRFRQPQ